MSSNNERETGEQGAAELSTEPLSSLDARRVEEDAVHRAMETSEEVSQSRRRGRIEAETHRVSEEVTHQAQERLRAAQDSGAPAERTAQSAEESSQSKLAQPGRTIAEPLAIHRLLVPLDGTSYAERALPYANAVARATGASIVLAHVTEPAPPHPRGVLRTIVDGVVTDTSGVNDVDSEAYLRALQTRLQPSVSSVDVEVTQASSVSDGIMALEKASRAEIVVLATHARQGLERRVLGSVGDQVIKRGNLPVFFVPPQLEVAGDTLPSLARVLVPLDGSQLAERALDPVLTLAMGRAGASPAVREIVLMYVAENSVIRREGATYLNDIRDMLLELPVPAEVSITTVAVVGSAPGAIVGTAERGAITTEASQAPFDFVAMATHGRGGLGRWIYGSVAEYVLPRIAVPVLLVHPSETDM